MDLKGSHVKMFKNQMVKFDLIRISVEMVKVNLPFQYGLPDKSLSFCKIPFKVLFHFRKTCTRRERERERERERHGVMGVKFNNLAFGGRVSTHNHDGSLFQAGIFMY